MVNGSMRSPSVVRIQPLKSQAHSSLGASTAAKGCYKVPRGAACADDASALHAPRWPRWCSPPESPAADYGLPGSSLTAADPTGDAPAAGPEPTAQSRPASGWDAARGAWLRSAKPLLRRCRHSGAARRSRLAARCRACGKAHSSSTLRIHSPQENPSASPPLRSQSKACFSSTRLRKRTKPVNHLPGLFCKVSARVIPRLCGTTEVVPLHTAVVFQQVLTASARPPWQSPATDPSAHRTARGRASARRRMRPCRR